MKEKKSISRVAAEEKEGLDIISNELPENRVQTEQQVQNTDAAQHTKGADSSFAPKRSSAKGQTLKQETISEAITGSSSSAGMGINFAGRGVSGTVGGILGAANSTPQADQSRSKSRTGKKLDRIATKLNYTPAETCLLNVDESKPLADSADKDQGYNGTYRNEFGRSQKIMGAVPGDLMFQRSVDLIMKDKLYFVEGQQVFQNNDDRNEYDPTIVVDMTADNSDTVHYTPTHIKAGNYLHRAAHFGLTSGGDVRYCYFDVDDLTHDAVSPEDANIASAHRLIKMNVAELDRMAIDAKAGDEKADLWSPLARAISEPTKWSYLLSSIEADTGAYCHLAYSKGTTNFAYQLNRGAKDGLSTIIPGQEQLCGWRSTNNVSTAFQDADHQDLKSYFTQANYRLGDPSLMIEAYDSISKYNNKADLLLQPRGWRMHFQTADNNINALRVPAEYANVYAGTEVFSTIDREYDPLMPICMTDKANLVTVHNFNELAAFYNQAGYRDVRVIVTTTDIDPDYDYKDYKVAEINAVKAMGWPELYVYTKGTVNHPIVYDDTNNVFIIDDAGNNETNQEFGVIASPEELNVTDQYLDDDEQIPNPYYGYVQNQSIDLTFTHDIIFRVPTVTAKVTKAQVKYDVNNDSWLYYNTAKLAYAYSDLRNNYIVHVKHPLVFGIIEYLRNAIGGKIRTLLGREEFYVPFVFSTQYMTLAQLLICAATPWIQRVRLNSMRDVIYYEDNTGSYPYSKLASIKDVPFKNYVNFNYSDYDTPLSTKVMNPVQAINWVMPEFFWKVDTRKYVLPWYFCENELNADGTVDDDASNMCFPSIRSGIRLGFLDDMYGMDEKDVRLSLDRMTKTFLRDTDIQGFNAYKYGATTDGQILAKLKSDKIFSLAKILAAPRELGLCMDAPIGILTPDPILEITGATNLSPITADGTYSSYRIKVWTNTNTLKEPSILNANGVNITRAANYAQKWFEILANGDSGNAQLTGLVFGLGDDTLTFSPFAALGTGASASLGVNVLTHQRAVYTRLQLLPFVISPFDASSASSLGASWDIYDFAYYFGLAGFRASDYRESVYNRSKEVVNQGMLFITDPWIEASPIIKGAASSTGVKMTKGYTLR